MAEQTVFEVSAPVNPSRCLTCGKDFIRSAYSLKHGKGLYCSRVCARRKRARPATVIFATIRQEICIVPLTKGKYAITDAADAELVSKYIWRVRNGSTIYACTSSHGVGRQSVGLHNIIMGPTPNGMMLDHVDRDGLNNRRSNLRFVTPSFNRINTKRNRNASSQYRGVARTSRGKWRSGTCRNWKKISFGEFDTEKEAAMAYDKNIVAIHGPDAPLNFPSSGRLQ